MMRQTTFAIRSGVLALVLAACGPVQAAIVSVNQSIAYTDPPTAIVASNNPFTFLFTSLPTNALTDVFVRMFGIADVDGVNLGTPADESFSVTVDGVPFGTFAPGSFNFDESFQIPLASLSGYLADGALSIVVNFANEVNAPLTGDSITTSISYRADTGSVPEPGTLALLGLSLAGLAATRRRKQ